MNSPLGFLLVALVVTLTPGPATANVIRVAARDGRGAALSATVGNSVGVLCWGMLSALGVSSLVLASEVAFMTLKIAGAAALVILGVRAFRARRSGAAATPDGVRRAAGWRGGLVTGMSNPKLAIFFVALFPQFLRPGEPVLPYAMAMAATVVVLDVLWFSTLAVAVDRARVVARPRVQAAMERVSGAVMVSLGLRLAIESR